MTKARRDRHDVQVSSENNFHWPGRGDNDDDAEEKTHIRTSLYRLGKTYQKQRRTMTQSFRGIRSFGYEQREAYRKERHEIAMSTGNLSSLKHDNHDEDVPPSAF